MGKQVFQYILFSIATILLFECSSSEFCYNDTSVSCYEYLNLSRIILCDIYTSNSSIISNAFKVCTFGKKYKSLLTDIYITEGSIELTLELGDNITYFDMFLQHNSYSQLNVSILPVKQHLYITTLAFLRINLNLNVFQSLSYYFPNLEKIDISEMNAVQTLNNFITGLKSLSTFSWTNGLLVNISKNAFAGLTSLSLIDLSDNFISYLSSFPFQNLPFLKNINLYGNPLNCSACGLQWMSVVDSKFGINVSGTCVEGSKPVESVASHSQCHSTESYQCFNKSFGCENTCINTPCSYICMCDEGFGLTLNEEEQSCVDIDECQQNASLCQGMECRNTMGSYQCYCEVGFYADGSNACTDINECLSSPCEHICNNTVGSYHCLSNVNPQFSTTTETSSLPLVASVLSSVTTIFIVITCLQTLIIMLCLISFIIAFACMKWKHSKSTPSKAEQSVDVNKLKLVEEKQNKKQHGEYIYLENEETREALKQVSYPAESKDYLESSSTHYVNLKVIN